jgi:hypothetical protein
MHTQQNLTLTTSTLHTLAPDCPGWIHDSRPHARALGAGQRTSDKGRPLVISDGRSASRYVCLVRAGCVGVGVSPWMWMWVDMHDGPVEVAPNGHRWPDGDKADSTAASGGRDEQRDSSEPHDGGPAGLPGRIAQAGNGMGRSQSGDRMQIERS